MSATPHVPSAGAVVYLSGLEHRERRNIASNYRRLKLFLMIPTMRRMRRVERPPAKIHAIRRMLCATSGIWVRSRGGGFFTRGMSGSSGQAGFSRDGFKNTVLGIIEGKLGGVSCRAFGSFSCSIYLYYDLQERLARGVKIDETSATLPPRSVLP